MDLEAAVVARYDGLITTIYGTVNEGQRCGRIEPPTSGDSRGSGCCSVESEYQPVSSWKTFVVLPSSIHGSKST